MFAFCQRAIFSITLYIYKGFQKTLPEPNIAPEMVGRWICFWNGQSSEAFAVSFREGITQWLDLGSPSRNCTGNRLQQMEWLSSDLLGRLVMNAVFFWGEILPSYILGLFQKPWNKDTRTWANQYFMVHIMSGSCCPLLDWVTWM